MQQQQQQQQYGGGGGFFGAPGMGAPPHMGGNMGGSMGGRGPPGMPPMPGMGGGGMGVGGGGMGGGGFPLPPPQQQHGAAMVPPGGNQFFSGGAMPPGPMPGRGGMPPGPPGPGGSYAPPPPPPPPGVGAGAGGGAGAPSSSLAGVPPPPPPPPRAGSSKENRSGEPESEADAAKRREKRKLEEKDREKKRAEEQRRREVADRERNRQLEVIPLTSDVAGASRKLEMGDFVCAYKFDGSLPALPADPKLVELPFDTQSFAKFRYDSKAEAGAKYELLAEPDLGITIDLVDPQAYDAPPDARLSHEDEVLLSAHAFALATGEKKTATQNAKELRQEVTFLRKTPLLGNNLYDAIHKHSKAPIERQHVVQQSRALQKLGEDQPSTLADVVANIEKSFQDAEEITGRTLQHPSNPNLTAVSILPVLPDVECWENAYVQATFDVDPGLDKKGDEEALFSKERVSRAIMKEFKGVSGSNAGKSFIGMLAPPEGADADAGEPEEVELEWMRDYKFQLGADSGESYFLVVGENEASYNAFEQSLKLTRGSYRRVHERPSKITLARRAADDDEQRAAVDRRVLLLKGEKVYQLTDKSGGSGGADDGEGDRGESSGAAAGDDDDDPFGGADGEGEGGDGAAPAEDEGDDNALMDDDDE